MAKRKRTTKKKTKEKTAESVEDPIAVELPEEAPAPTPSTGDKCDTCGRRGPLMKCPYCGHTYCYKCRTPYKGHYANCQFCGAVL